MQADWAQLPPELAERWEATCRKRDLRQQVAFFVSLGWGTRRCKLFTVACLRVAFAKRLNQRSRSLLDLIERRADDPTVQPALIAEVNAIARERDHVERYGSTDKETQRNCGPVLDETYAAACQTPAWAAGSMAALRRHRALFATILAAMVGPGWRWREGWRTRTTVALACSGYDERDWEAMPILGDALEEAGCDDASVLGYCRGDGPFFRGCWVLDAILANGDEEPAVQPE
jgi:hypothetical protein